MLEFVAGLLGGMPDVWGTPACSCPRAPGLAAGAAITHKLSVRQVRAAFTVLMLIAAWKMTAPNRAQIEASFGAIADMFRSTLSASRWH